MSYRYWVRTGVYWALAGIAILMAVGILLSTSYELTQRHQRQDVSPKETYTATGQAAAACEGIATLIEYLQCVADKAKAARAEQRKQYDLEAQQDMALWAFGVLWISALIGIVSLTVAWVVAWFVRDTLRETRRTAIAGIVSARAANKGLRQSDENAKRQLRAYVCVTKGVVTQFGPDKTPGVIIQVKNTGQTPAYDVMQWTCLDLDDFPRTKPFIDDWNWGSHKSTLGPGEGMSAIISLDEPLTQNHVDVIREGNAAIWAFGELRYTDAFDVPHTTQFRLVYGGNLGALEKGKTKGAMANDADGNGAD